MSIKNYKGVLHGDQVQEMFEAAKKHQTGFGTSVRIVKSRFTTLSK